MSAISGRTAAGYGLASQSSRLHMSTPFSMSMMMHGCKTVASVHTSTLRLLLVLWQLRQLGDQTLLDQQLLQLATLVHC